MNLNKNSCRFKKRPVITHAASEFLLVATSTSLAGAGFCFSKT